MVSNRNIDVIIIVACVCKGTVVSHRNTDVIIIVACVCKGAVVSHRNTDVMTPVAHGYSVWRFGTVAVTLALHTAEPSCA